MRGLVTLLVVLAVGLIAGAFGGFLLATRMAEFAGGLSPMAAVRPGPCRAIIHRTVAFTAPGAKDEMTVKSSGPSCANLYAVVTIKAASGQVVFVNAQRIDALTDPKQNPDAVKGIKAILQDYAGIAESGARATLPEWRAGAPQIESTPTYSVFQSVIKNPLYRRVREADSPLLRLRSAPGSGAFFAYLPEIDLAQEVAVYTF